MYTLFAFVKNVLGLDYWCIQKKQLQLAQTEHISEDAEGSKYAHFTCKIPVSSGNEEASWAESYHE